MLKMNMTTVTVKTTTAQITAEDIRKKFRLPEAAVISIPAGGDSNEPALVLGKDVSFIEVTYAVKKIKGAKTAKDAKEALDAVENPKQE